MELQWPLILFVLFVSWSAGLFATQAVYAVKGECAKAQLPSLVASLALMAVGGVAVLFHLQHGERIFNGFGHITSGITQELIAIVVLVVVMAVYFVFLRRAEGAADGTVIPKWLSAVSVIMCVALVCVMGHSYMMGSRPAWNTLLEVLSLIGAACALGPATFVVICSFVKTSSTSLDSKTTMAGTIVAAITSFAYIIRMAVASSSFTSIGYYFDPVHPNYAMADPSALSPFAGEALLPTALTIVCVLCAIAASYAGSKKGNWKVCGSAIIALSVAACMALRVVFYLMGVSVYMFY